MGIAKSILDVVGNTPFAYPSILFGHNAHVTWGSTAGFGDDVDIYAEKLDPNDRTRYFHDGDQFVRARIEKQGITAGVFGDPPKGRSALDQREGSQ